MSKIFTEEYLQQLSNKVNQTDEFIKEAKYASFIVGFHDSTSNKKSWVEFLDGRVNKFGIDDTVEPHFTFVGESESWEQLADKEPLNRLVRRSKLTVTGDKRLCMKNWKMLWLFGQLIKEV